MPLFFAANHDDYMKNYENTGEERFMQYPVNLYTRIKSGYCHACQIFVRPSFLFSQKYIRNHYF